MKTLLVVVLAMCLGIYMFGCGKKESTEMQEQMSMESITAPGALEVTPTPEAKMPQAPAASPAVTEPFAVVRPEPLPPGAPYGKPSATEIQTALKYAGYYTGAVDGKIGPITKKAISDFQKANNLQADGKVGSRTWKLLKTHLGAQPQAAENKKR